GFAQGDPGPGRQENRPMTLRRPKPFGDYELLAEVGRDGPFVLYRARQPRLDRLVTLKLPAGGATAIELAARLRREAEATTRLECPCHQRPDSRGRPSTAGRWSRTQARHPCAHSS